MGRTIDPDLFEGTVAPTTEKDLEFFRNYFRICKSIGRYVIGAPRKRKRRLSRWSRKFNNQ